jgi:DNA polymerase-3 subunit delta
LVVLEAGDIKKRRRSQQADRAAQTGRRPALLCRQRPRHRPLIDEETREAGLTISREARAALHSLLGGDRMASRGELKKLCLYALQKGKIDSEDVKPSSAMPPPSKHPS